MQDEYELETIEFLKYGIKVYQRTMLSDSEGEHIKNCCAIAEYSTGIKICDMGCGVGYVAHQMNILGYETIGVTNSKFQYSYAIENFPEVTFSLEDMVKTSLKDNSFDVVQWMESIGYVDQIKAFAEAYRILKVGGRAIVKDFGSIGDVSIFNKSWDYGFIPAWLMIFKAEKCELRFLRAFAINGDGKRYEKFYDASTVMKQLHPIGVKGNMIIPFWYEFIKI